MVSSRSFTKPPNQSSQAIRAGTWATEGRGETAYRAFIPKPLPPDPPLVIDAHLLRRLEAASLALGRLDGIGRLLPGPDELLYSYVRKEAVLSSQIEGTQSSLADLLLHENSAVPGVPIDDVQEVSNYIRAMNHGVDYDLLQSVRTQGVWEQWLNFYLDGVARVADEAVDKIRELLTLFERDRKAVEGSRGGSVYQRVALHSNLGVYEYLRRRIAIRIPEAANALGTTKPTVTRALDELARLGIAREVTGNSRNRVYVYQEYLDVLNRDTAQQAAV